MPEPTDKPVDLQNQVIERLKANTTGFGGTDAIRQGVKEYQNLDSLVNSGELDQKTYTSISDAIRNYLQPIGNVSTKGSAGASAATAAGWYDIQNNYRNAEIYKNAGQILGRDLTPSEFAQVAPSFGNGSPRELEAGRAVLAQYAEQQKNTPQALEKKYQEGASQYGGQVNSVFQDLASRGASQDELNHFGKLLASGDVDEYTLRQFVQQLPEVTQAKDTASREALNTELTKYDQDFFNKGKENIISRYAQAGIQNSPSLDFALTNLMGDIQKERSSYLAGLGREDYTRGRDVQRDDYMTTLNRQFGNQDYSRQRTDALSDLLRGRSYDVSDYTTQQNDLMRLLASQPQQRRSRGTAQLVGGLGGAAIGGFATGGNPAAIGAGYQIGSGTGSYFD